MPKVTIEGTLGQVVDALGFEERPLTKRQIALHRSKQRREKLAADRRLIRSAFDLIRHDPNVQLLASNLAGALGGRLEVTGSLLDSARQIVTERS